MKKKGILLLLCLSLTSATLGFVACGETETETPHEHTYDTTKWESDATKHWHAATCDHATEKADVDGHVDANVDGTCDTCGYNGGHIHTYETVWQSDEAGHWKKADCFHDVTSQVEEHTADEMGDCTVCGYHVSDPDVSTVAKALNFAKANAGKVENGSIVLNGDYFGTITDYVYANGYLYTNTKQTQNNESAVYTESWYSTDAKGGIFAVKRNQDGEVTRMTEFSDSISAENLNGYQFVSPVTNTIGDFYGLEDLIAGLYEVGEANLNKDFTAKVENGKYSFSFGYFEDELFIVEVDFTLSGEYYIDNANVKVTSYGTDFNWDTLEYDTLFEVVPGATADDADTYKAKEGAEGYVQANYTIAQNVQAVVENEYPAEEVLVSSYKLVNAQEVEVGDTLTIEKGTTTYLYLAEVAPETAIIGLTDVNATGESVDNWDIFVGTEEDEAGNWAIYVRSYTVGDHTITLSVNGVEKTLTVTVVEAQPASLIVNGYEYGGQDWWGDDYYVPVSAASEITVYTGTSVILAAEADKGDDVSCTATVNGTAATLEEISWQNPAEYIGGYVNALVLDTTTAGKYTVVFTSAALATLTETITVNVVARPDMSEVLNGKYIYQAEGYNAWEVEFAPESDGAANGTMTIAQYVYEYDEKAEKDVLVKYDAKYAYAWKNEEGVESFETKLLNGYDFGAVVSVGEATDYKIEVSGDALVKETIAMVLAGTWSYDVFDYSVSWTEPVDTYTLTFNEDGTGVYKATGVEYYFTFTIGEFNEMEGTYPITIAADESATNVGEATAFGAGATVTFGKMFSMVTYTFDWTVLVDNGQVDEWENPINYQYSKPTVKAETGYVWPTELTVGDVLNVYNGQFEQGVKQIELLINADKAGTYTISVCKWGETSPIATLDQYYFDMNGMKIVGALTFEVAKAERIVLTMGIVNEFFDFDVIVDFVEAATEEDDSAATNGAAFTVTTDMQMSSNQGEYTYAIDADGNITIYDGTSVASFSETYALKYADGKLTVYSGTVNEKELTKYSDTDTSVLAGSWNWAFSGMTAFDFTFAQAVAPSTMTVTTDMQMSSNQGEYTWTIDDAGNVTVYSNGVEATNFTITFVGGELTYNGTVMTKTSDADTSVLAGTWTYSTFYEITFTGTGAGASVGGNQSGAGTETTGAFAGTYAATDDWGNEITVVITDDSITFTPPGPAGQEIVWTYVLSGDSITLYSGGDEITNPLAGMMTVSNGVAVAMSYNGTNYTLAKA